MHRARRLLLVSLLVAVAACSGHGKKVVAGPTTSVAVPRPDSSGLPAPPLPDPVVVAQAAVPSVPVFDGPSAAGPANRTVDSPRPSGAPAVFLVQQQQGDLLQVLLPTRPNGSSGWIRAADVTLTQHHWHLVVELGAHRLTVFSGSDVVRVETIGVGTQGTPTPGGRWFTTELLQPPTPDGPYGPYAYGLSGFTGAPGGTAGVDGQLGLHGTNDPSTLGKDVSLGCIRMSNDAISALATQLPLGVPVDVLK